MAPGKSAGQQVTRRRARADQLRAQAAETIRRAEEADHQADLWERGQVGEQTVGAALDGLREHGYEVLHDLRWPGGRSGSIDHVAIGPAGILVINAKNWSGEVSVADGRLRRNGFGRERELDAVRRAGVDVAELLQLPWALHLIPVRCVSGGRQVTPMRCGEVTVIDVARVRDWVFDLPQNLTPADVLRVAADLRRQLPTAAMPDRPPTSTRHRHKKPAREDSALPLLLTKLVFLLVGVLAVPGTLYWWSAHGPDHVHAAVPRPSVAASPHTPVYNSCSELWRSAPGGVARPGALNTGRKLAPDAVVTTSRLLYLANARLDTDSDGIACEVESTSPTAP